MVKVPVVVTPEKSKDVIPAQPRKAFLPMGYAAVPPTIGAKLP
jgi:hypothetical protein